MEVAGRRSWVKSGWLPWVGEAHPAPLLLLTGILLEDTVEVARFP
jgi:hypothetical protein